MIWLAALLLLGSQSLQGRELVFYEQNFPIPKTAAEYRNYHAAVSKEEKKDIRFILKSMAKKNVVSLLKSKSDLKAAGSRIEHIHPLRFLQTIFSDEEMKAYFHQIKKRGGWVWPEFSKGLKNTLQDEYNKKNMEDLFIFDFAANLNLDPNLVYDPIRNAHWDDFIKILLQSIPRDGQYDGLDM